MEDDDDDDEGTKSFFKIAQNRICNSLVYIVYHYEAQFVTSQNLVGIKFWSSWVVAMQISKSHPRRGLQKNHAQLQNTDEERRLR